MAKPRPKTYRLSDSQGLYVEVAPNGSRYWRMKYRFAGEEKRLAFGVYPIISLAKALEEAREVICPLLIGPELLLFWIEKEIWNAIQEAQTGRDHRQAARG